MFRSVSRWVLLTGAFWVLGPAAAYLLLARRATDGGSDVTLLISDDVAMSLLAGLVAMVFALGAGIATARLFGTRSGLFTAGLVLVWPAWAAGSIMGLLRHSSGSSALWTLALEGLLLGAATAAAAIIIARAPARATVPTAGQATRFGGARLMPALPIALGVAIVAALAVARTELPGQAIAAAFVAGLLGTMAASIVEPRLNPGIVLACLALLACVGPASAAAIEGDAAMRHLYDGSIMPLARITPLHWAAGLMLGVPVGASWASGFHRKPHG